MNRLYTYKDEFGSMIEVALMLVMLVIVDKEEEGIVMESREDQGELGSQNVPFTW